MKQKRIFETLLGAMVIIGALFFAGMLYNAKESAPHLSYNIQMRFSSAQGLKEGAEVRIAGVKVGTVSSLNLDPNTLEAIVSIDLDQSISLPDDTSAEITTAGLLGENFLRLKAGQSETKIAEDGEIQNTSDPVSLEDLLGKAIFALSNK